MQKKLKALAVATSSAALAFGGFTGVATAAPQGDVSVQVTCYGGAKSYSKAAGRHTTAVFKTSTRCADIDIKTNTTRSVKVCFKLSSGSFDCQSSYKSATANAWKVIATDIQDNQEFVFYFESTAATGSYAA
ncbi:MULTISPECIES: hypothetical protein [unclassified Streptomyces]|uniref:hypothetical protein n=1 Tax=unclassified Streptomyces TaxID=2593676 RepID=UPI00093D12A0|nr:hypothetical protein [Streptomyces sp. TSRI0281]OKI48194.1 hypothetical protein A6A29_03920 [Streptomyces sp. TSRI0281]